MFLFLTKQGFAQTINGYVTDTLTGEKLVGASIYISSQQYGTITNNYGFYSLSIKSRDTIVVTVSYVGYMSKKKTIQKSNANLWLNFKLTKNNSIGEVIITAQKNIQETTEMSIVEIPIKQIQTLPMLAGETDIMKAMQLMPGIKSGQEGQSGLYVRGGSHDQNLVLLDDVPLYYVNHLGGFVSVFNADVLNSVKLFKGGFPARYGSRLSSVIDVRMKEGDMKKHKQNITIGIISSKISAEGPLKKDTASYILSIRRFMYDLLSRPISKYTNGGTSVAYTFYDINAKLNYKVSRKNRLYLSFYIGNDKTINKKKEKDDGEKEDMKNKSLWGNFLLSLRWNHVFGDRLFGNATLYTTRYRYASNFSYILENIDETFETKYNFSSEIYDLGLKIDFDYDIFDNYTIRFGSKNVYHTFKPNITSMAQKTTNTSGVDTSFNYLTYDAIENTFYVENDYNFHDLIKMNIGLRANSYTIESKNYLFVEPRILFNFNIANYFAIKTSYSKMVQNVHLLTYSGAGLPSDLWMPATTKVPPQKSEQLALGIAKALPNKNLEISVEAYYKRMYDLVDYQDGVGIAGNNTQDWQNLIETDGVGMSKGIEFLLQKKTGRLSGWLGYTLSETTRQFKNINNGNPYYYTYDATHDISIVANFKLKNNLTMSASWVYTTGRAITLPNELFYVVDISYLEGNNGTEETINYERRISSYYEKNNIRMNPYHRLDVGITYTKQKKKSKRILKIGIYNLYNRRNAYYYFTTLEENKNLDGTGTGKQVKKVYQRSLFPFIPSVSYTFKF
jgi:hypothetical protein